MQIIIIILILIFVPIPLLAITASLFGAYWVFIFIGAILMLLWQFSLGDRIKLNKKVKELQLNSKSNLELKNLLKHEEDIFNKKMYELVMKKSNLSSSMQKTYAEKQRENLVAIQSELKRREKANKNIEKKKNDSVIKNILFTIITAIVSVVGGVLIVVIILETAYQKNIYISPSIESMLILLPIILMIFSFPIQRIVRFKNQAFKKGGNESI